MVTIPELILEQAKRHADQSAIPAESKAVTMAEQCVNFQRPVPPSIVRLLIQAARRQMPVHGG